MAAGNINDSDQFPVVIDLKDFDVRSGNWLEKAIFNNRLAVLLAFALLSTFLAYHALRLDVNASFENTIPSSHPYIRNFLDNRKDLRGLGNSLRIVVENANGDIFDPAYLKVLQDVSDTATLLPGVDRPWVKSLWTPLVRWSEVTEVGMEGGPVMPDVFDGSSAVIEQLRLNIARANIVGQLVAGDYRSSAVIVPLLDKYPDTGKPLDYAALSQDLERQIRAKETPTIKIHITGFAKLVGDLIDGLKEVMAFFAVSAVIAGLIVFFYTRCTRSTLLLVGSAVLGVVCLLGMMQLLGFELDPYSILVPFLIFAIGLSHGAQKMNGIMQDVGRGVPKYVAARYTFRRLFLAGLTALLANVVGFAVLMIIDIPVIRNLALTTSIGVTVLIFTKLIFIPVALSYIGVSPKAAAQSVREYKEELQGRSVVGHFWRFFDHFTMRYWAGAAVGVAALIAVLAFTVSLHIKIGDLDAGAPELRQESRYNRDVAFINAAYGTSSDQFAVIVKTPPGACDTYPVLLETGRLATELEDVEGVLGTTSFYSQVVRVLSATNEGNPKWASLYRQPKAIGTAVERSRYDAPDAFSPKCSVAPLIAYLQDHKAETLDRVLEVVESFAAKHDQPDLQFLPAAGSAGIEAITNIVVREANTRMLLVLYTAVALLCFLTFRNWRAVVVALIPLVITSMLCEAIMVWLGIGIKVATLPVIALGVGVGVDYALYLLSIQLSEQRRGRSLAEAYQRALASTGKIVGLVGMTMSAAVVTWAWSPIKFQADMGILLTFMFLWNMLGALILIPALSHFLLQQPAPKAAESKEARRRLPDARGADLIDENVCDTNACRSSQ